MHVNTSKNADYSSFSQSTQSYHKVANKGNVGIKGFCKSKKNDDHWIKSPVRDHQIETHWRQFFAAVRSFDANIAIIDNFVINAKTTMESAVLVLNST